MSQPKLSKTSSVSWGMDNYLNKYLPRLAQLGDSLRELTKKNVPFI